MASYEIHFDGISFEFNPLSPDTIHIAVSEEHGNLAQIELCDMEALVAWYRWATGHTSPTQEG